MSVTLIFSIDLECTFKSTKKLNRDIIGLLNKPSKFPGNCIFHLSNPPRGPILDCMPKSNLYNTLIILCICSDSL